MQGFQIPSPQTPDPLATLSQMQQMKTQRLQQQGAGLQLQQEQQKMDSNKALLAAMAGGGGDIDKTVDLATQSGKVLPGDILSLREHHLKMQQDAATLDKTTRENLATDSERYRSLIAGGQSQDDVDAANATADKMNIDKRVPRFTQYTDPSHLSAFSNSLTTQANVLKEASERATAGKEQAAQAASEAQTTETKQKTAAGDREAARKELLAEVDPATGIVPPDRAAQIQKKYPTVMLPQTAAGIAAFVRSGVDPKDLPEYDIKNKQAAAMSSMKPQDWDTYLDSVIPPSGDTAALNARTKAQVRGAIASGSPMTTVQGIVKDASDQIGRTETGVRTAKATVPIKIELAQGEAKAALTGAGVNAPGTADLHGEDYLKTINPGLAAQLRSIAKGDTPAPTGRAAVSGPGAMLTRALYQYDPEFTPLLGQMRKDTLKEFTDTSSSKAGGQLMALNTMIHHADLYQEVADSMKNGSWRPGNAAYNAVATMFGKAPPIEANLVGRFLAGETGKVVGEQAQGEINGILKSLETDASPEQISAAGQRMLQIAAGRMIPLKERIQKAKLEKFVDVVGPDAQQILSKRGFDPNTMQPARAGAGSPTVTTKQQRDALPSGTVYIGPDGKQYLKK
jgi:hypothetical protein